MPRDNYVSNTTQTPQSILNDSFDRDFGVIMTEPVRRTEAGTGIEYFRPAAEGGLFIPTFDYASQTQAATTDTWVFKTGGVSGATVATVVITYTDSTKAVISNVAQS